MPVPTPAEMIKVLRIIGRLPWAELTDNDHAAFADAGPQARIAPIDAESASHLAELFDIRPDLTGKEPMMAIIGGDHLVLEIHGIERDGTPIGLSYDLHPNEQ